MLSPGFQPGPGGSLPRGLPNGFPGFGRLFPVAPAPAKSNGTVSF